MLVVESSIRRARLELEGIAAVHIDTWEKCRHSVLHVLSMSKLFFFITFPARVSQSVSSMRFPLQNGMGN
jgi:hypothetical protein